MPIGVSPVAGKVYINNVVTLAAMGTEDAIIVGKSIVTSSAKQFVEATVSTLKGVISYTTVEKIITILTVERVISYTTFKIVIPCTAVERVISCTSIKCVIALITPENVTTLVAI